MVLLWSISTRDCRVCLQGRKCCQDALRSDRTVGGATGLATSLRSEIRNWEMRKETGGMGRIQKTVLEGGTDASCGTLGWSPVSLGSQGSAATTRINIVPANRNNRVEGHTALDSRVLQAAVSIGL